MISHYFFLCIAFLCTGVALLAPSLCSSPQTQVWYNCDASHWLPCQVWSWLLACQLNRLSLFWEVESSTVPRLNGGENVFKCSKSNPMQLVNSLTIITFFFRAPCNCSQLQSNLPATGGLRRTCRWSCCSAETTTYKHVFNETTSLLPEDPAKITIAQMKPAVFFSPWMRFQLSLPPLCPGTFQSGGLVPAAHRGTINGASPGDWAAPPGGSPPSTGTPSASLSRSLARPVRPSICPAHCQACFDWIWNLWSLSAFQGALRLRNTKKRRAGSNSRRVSLLEKKRKRKRKERKRNKEASAALVSALKQEVCGKNCTGNKKQLSDPKVDFLLVHSA